MLPQSVDFLLQDPACVRLVPNNLELTGMMPKAAADALKIGQSVHPELYENSTVFFSDIVGFTILASKSSPLQVSSSVTEQFIRLVLDY